MMTYLEETVTVGDGVRLYVRRHEAQQPRAEIILVHGFGEHSGRYVPLIGHLVAHHYAVIAYDHRGHGQSDGLQGHVERFRDYESDLERIIEYARTNAHSDQLFLIGHSMGGLVVLRELARGRPDIAGAVISAPLLELAAEVPATRMLVARVGARLMPRLRMDNGIDPSALSRDPEVGRAYSADPLVHHLISARWFAEATAAMAEVREQSGRIRTPLLVLQGTDDRLVCASATREFFDRVASRDKELEIYPGYYHELFNEPEKHEIYVRVTRWLDAHSRG